MNNENAGLPGNPPFDREEVCLSLLNSMGDAVHIVDTQLRIVVINGALRKWCVEIGIPQDIVGLTVLEAFPFLPESVLLEYGQVMETGRPLVTDESTSTAGMELYTETTKIPVIENGSTAWIITVLRDVTDRQYTIEELRESQDRLQSLFEGIDDAIFVHDMEGRILDCNGAACRRLGYERRELLGMRTQDIDEPEFAKGFDNRLRQQVLTGRYSGEGVHIGKDGKRIPVDINTSIITYRGKKAVLAVMRDITRRRKVEHALQESERHYRQLIDNLPEGVVVHCAGKVVFVNSSMAEMLGGKVTDFIGKPVIELVHPNFRKDVEERSRTVLQQGASVPPMEETLLKLDGTHLEASVTALPFTYEGKPAVQVVVRDLTHQRKLEHQLLQAQKMEGIGQLAGGVAHDFNNILQTILGHVVFAKAGLSPESDRYNDIDTIGRSAEKAAQLTRQLLAFSRRQIIEPVNLDANRLIGNMLKMLQRLIGEHIELKHLQGNNLGCVLADPAQLEQVIVNLVVNARDAMPDGGTIVIETGNAVLNGHYCEIHPWATPGEYVLISVTDSGSGMDQSTKERIFEPFFTTKEEGHGTGLGLATVYGIVKQHEGLIHVYSEVGKGTTFRIYLPLVVGAVSEVSPRPEPTVPGGSETILVAEDDAMVRNLTIRMLERGGYTVMAAPNGEEAVTLFRKHAHEIDLALLDIVMPGLGGRHVYEKIKALRPDVPVLFSSGYSSNAIHTRFVIDEGMQLIQKPYDLASLLTRIREMLDAVE